MYCRVLQCLTNSRCAWCRVLQCYVVCCSVLLCVAVSHELHDTLQVRESGRGFNPNIANLRTWQPNPSQYRWQPSDVPLGTHSGCCVLQCFVVCCSVLLCVAGSHELSHTIACSLPMCLDSRGGVCCSVVLCVAVFCCVMQCLTNSRTRSLVHH